MEKIKPIGEHLKEMKEGKGFEKIGFYLKSGWIFEKGYEKSGLILIGIMGIWKIYDLIKAL